MFIIISIKLNWVAKIYIYIFVFQAMERLAQLIRVELAGNYIENVDTW